MNRKIFPTLTEAIRNSFVEYADFPCLEVGGEKFSYAEIGSDCAVLANCIDRNTESEEKFVGVFACRSKSSYVGIYGTLSAGKGYLPMSPRLPADRLKKIVEISKLKTIILGEECVDSLRQFAGELDNLKVLCFLKIETFAKLKSDFPQHEFEMVEEFREADKFSNVQIFPDNFAYLVFTSGSTGIPKGVAITHENVCAYANYQIDRYDISPADKMSQMPDITFDLSIHDLFVSIMSGACLAVVDEAEMIAPAKFIKEKEITFWTSVPSVVVFLERFKMLKPNVFPTIRRTMFCGEALPANSAELWQNAAPNSIIENTYGPTEATVAITNYVWDSETSPAECQNGIVPLGKIFSSQKVKLVDENQNVVNFGEIGEIYLGGSQVAPGYFNDAEKTAEKFVRFSDNPQILWYKTGDLARMDESGILYYAGRIDDQVKVRGYRVELQEIDGILREFAGTNLAISTVNKSKNGTTAILGFVQGANNEDLRKRIFEGLRRVLPEYMIPSEIRFIDEIPFNRNGKIDRKMLEAKI